MLDDAALLHRLNSSAGIAREAGRLALSYFDQRDQLLVELKGPHDLVSLADRAVEQVIRDRLRALFPDDAIVGEEHGGDAREVAWYVDPIDGTQNFLRGLPWFCVTMALQTDGETRLGITYDPNRDELFTARRGGGTFLNGNRVQVRDTGSLDHAVLGVGHSPRHGASLYVEPVARCLEHGAQTRNLCCAALQLAYVACGRLDGTWDPYLLPWDVMAGILMVEEAGGRAMPFEPVLHHGGGVLRAGTPGVFEAMTRLRIPATPGAG